MPVNRMPWGKYRGILLEDVPANYLRWVLRDCGNVSLHLRRAIQDVLARAGDEPDSAPAPGAAQPTTVAACVPVLEPVLKTWFRDLVMAYHPDRGGAREAMVAVTDARDRLYRALGLPVHGH